MSPIPMTLGEIRRRRLMILPCGCQVPYNRGRIMSWLLHHQYIGLFDLLHTERFVKQHRTQGLRGKQCV